MTKYLLAALFAFPFAFLMVLSFGQQWRYPALFPQEWTLGNWFHLFQAGSGLGRGLVHSLLLSAGMAFAGTSLGFLTARQLVRHRWRRQLLVLAYFPYVLAPVILAAMLQYYFMRLGLAGKLAGVMLAQLFLVYPFAVVFFFGFWNERMLALEQQAATLGATAWQRLSRVLLPAARGALAVCYFQTFLISWFEYGLTALIGVGKVQTLTVKVFQYIGEANLFLAALASLLLALPPLLLLWVNRQVLFK